MATERDKQLVRYLLSETRAGKIAWEPTATRDQYTVSFKGKYRVLVDKGTSSPWYWMKLKNESDQELLSLDLSEMPTGEIRTLFEEARRSALDVDAAINEIMGPEH